MPKEIKHSKFPFKYFPAGFEIRDADDSPVASDIHCHEIGEFVTKACNSHYELLEACNFALGYIIGDEKLWQLDCGPENILKVAISKAKDRYKPSAILPELKESLKKFKELEPEINKILEGK